MTSTTATPARPSAPVGRTARRVGRVVTGLVTLFLLFDSVTKLLRVPAVVTATAQMGFPVAAVPVIGATLLACVVLYLVPRTAVLGAVLLTGYLGGAVFAHVRVGDPLLTHVLMPIYVAAMLWGGLYLRDARVRALLR